MTNGQCRWTNRQDTAERYVSRQMGREEAEAFEDHFVSCAECQREIEFATAVRTGLREGSAGAHSIRRREAVWIAAGLALAAGIAGLMVFSPLGRVNRWGDLGAVPVAPIYLGVEVRGTPARGDSVFAAAMKVYEAKRYDAASTGLRNALAAGADSVPTEFFLGAALLMQDRAAEAADAFSRVIALGETPYQGEARLYRAKALLRMGRAAEAVKELRGVNSPSDAINAWAKALADSIESRQQR